MDEMHDDRQFQIEIITKFRKEILSEIAQTLIYFEHIKDSLVLIIRETIFPRSTIIQNKVIRLLIEQDNVPRLIQKTKDIFKAYNKTDELGIIKLQKITKCFESLALIRNNLAHSRSFFGDYDGVEPINVSDWDYIKINSKRGRRVVRLSDMENLNIAIIDLSNAFSHFTSFLREPAELKVNYINTHLSDEELTRINIEFDKWMPFKRKN